jgi:hypothetical protein
VLTISRCPRAFRGRDCATTQTSGELSWCWDSRELLLRAGKEILFFVLVNFKLIDEPV